MIEFTKKKLLEQFSGKTDKEVIFRKLRRSDVDAIKKFIPENFYRISYMSDYVVDISLEYTNFDKSFVAVIDGEVAGCVLLGDSQMPTPNNPIAKGFMLNKKDFLPIDYTELSNMVGVEIVLLGVNQKYRGYNLGLGLLKHMIKNIDVDYLWGGQMADLENQAFWDRISTNFYDSPNLKMNYRVLKK